MIKLLTQDSTGNADAFITASNVLILLFATMNVFFIADASLSFFLGTPSLLQN